MHIPDQESRGHIQSTWIYLVAGLVLFVLTTITVAASYVDWGSVIGGGFATNIIIALVIASIKAFVVLMFFMHMRYEGFLVWGFGIVYPILLFALLLVFLATDIFLRVKPDQL